MEKLLYIYNVNTTWTAKDLALLQEAYEVDEAFINTKTLAFKFANPFELMKYKKVFCWFGSLKFLPVVILSKLLGKEVIIVAGGFDVAKVPSIKYGGFCRSLPSMILRKFIFKMANKVITVSNFNTSEAINNAGINESKLKMIHHGFKPLDIKVKPFLERKDTVLTVGAINQETMERKGHRRFIELAKECPDLEFVMVGKYEFDCKTEIERANIPNLKLKGFIDENELKDLMNKSKFYAQLSEHEAFGCSVVEAGMAGCTLIVSNKSALPEIVEPVGFIFNPDKVQPISAFIKSKLNCNEVNSEAVSSSFTNRFSESLRKQELINFIQ